MAGEPHKCHRRFTRPPELLAGSPLISCTLLSLPAEVLLHIFEELDPIDLVCLALASRRLLQVSAMLRIRIPSVAKHRNLLPSTCPRIYDLLWRFRPQVDVKLQPTSRKYALCCDCLQYRPRKKIHWMHLSRMYSRTRGVKAECWKRIVHNWYSSWNAQCPECYCKENYSLRPA